MNTYIGEPLKSRQAINAIFKDNIMYITISGRPCIFNVYNLKTNILINSFPLPNTKLTWIHTIDQDGVVSITADGYFFTYDPKKDEFKNHGRFCETERTSFVMDIDPEGNNYIGSYPNAKIIKFNKKKSQFEDLGRVVEKANYVRSIACDDRYIYTGTFGEGRAKFIRVNKENPSIKKEFPLPIDNVEWLYTMNRAGKLLIIFTKTPTTTKMLVFDTQIQEFVDLGLNGVYKGLYSSSVINDETFFFMDSKIYSLNVKTKKVTDYDFHVGEMDLMYACYPISSTQIITLESKNSNLLLFNLKTKTIKKLLTPALDYGRYEIQSLEKGANNELYLGAYAGDIAVKYNIATNEIFEIPIKQIEGSIHYKGAQYFGVYPKAWIYEYKSNIPLSESNPKNLGRVDEHQDRPFTLVAYKDKIISGTITDYGLHGGAIGIYDLTTNKKTAIRNIVKDQSIMSLCVKDGILYGSTTVYGGLGALPKEEQAKIFTYDLEKNKKIDEFLLNLEGIEKPLHIGSIAFDNKGRLWGVTGYTLFCMDVETKKIIHQISFDKYNYDINQHVWRPIYIRFDKKDNLYVNIKGIKKVNIKTFEVFSITEKHTNLFTIADDGQIYYSIDSKLYKITIN